MYSCIGFLAFSLFASLGYVINDLLDVFADRAHVRKRSRPFASGDLSIGQGVGLCVALGVAATLLALQVGYGCLAIAGGYFLLSLLYSIYYKRIVLVDVIVLALLYTVRIVAGAIIIDVELTFWLLAFSVFLFYSLALVKRCVELVTLEKEGALSTKGRDYRVSDISYLRTMGISSGYVAVMIFALYINSPQVTELYSRPLFLWACCPVLLYWISRLWIKTAREEVHDDPIIFALKDRTSLVAMVIMAIAIFCAM
jgi:4-hydroxybenzoate polyprenyltransferase